jgi:predicted dehydrogenase
MKIGIMSFAHVHAAGYARLLAATPGIEVVAADPGDHPDGEVRGAMLAAELGVYYLDDYEDLFTWEPDAVIITSENARHRADVERAAAAGAHILCEKPLATSWEDALAIRDAVARAGVTAMIAHPVRFSSDFARLRAQYRAGALGEVVAVRAANNGKMPTGRSWFTDPQLSGGGALADHVVHIADLVDALTGATPVRVTATSNRLLYADRDAESAAVILVEYSDGMIAALDSSWSVPQQAPAWGGLQMSVLGTDGTVDVDFFGSAVRGVTSSGQAVEARYGADLDATMLTCFLEAVRTGAQPQPDLETGLRGLSIVLAAQESAQTGRTVDIAELMER